MSDIHQIYQHILDLKQKSGETEAKIGEISEQFIAANQSQDEIKLMMNNINSQLERISETEHTAHHNYVKTIMDKAEARARLMDAITNEMAKKGALAAIALILTLIWAGATDHLTHFVGKIK